MKKVVAIILLFSLGTAAAEVTKFEPRPAVVEQEGATYVGILLSEEDFRKMLQKIIHDMETSEFYQQLKQFLDRDYDIFLDYPKGRSKPPVPSLSFTDSLKVLSNTLLRCSKLHLRTFCRHLNFCLLQHILLKPIIL